jgi:hypothetical protein
MATEKPEERLERWQQELREFLSNRHFKLDENRQLVPCESLEEAAEVFENTDRQVALTMLSGDAYVSTVFLCVDHGWLPNEPPVVFETAVVRDGEFDIVMRYSTWEQAEAGHRDIVQDVCKEESRTVIGEDTLSAEFLEV